MRTVTSLKSGRVWRLCSWNEACQMPVTIALDEKLRYCRWHTRCLSSPQIAENRDAFAMFLSWMQQCYPSTGAWGMPEELLWPVMQGVRTIADVEQEIA